MARVTTKDRQPFRKPRNVYIDPEAIHRARVEALRARKPLGQWLEELIDEKIERIEREEKKLK